MFVSLTLTSLDSPPWKQHWSMIFSSATHSVQLVHLEVLLQQSQITENKSFIYISVELTRSKLWISLSILVLKLCDNKMEGCLDGCFCATTQVDGKMTCA